MQKLHHRWKGQVEFVDVMVRQAHPGPGVRPYGSMTEKHADAKRYQRDERIGWPVLVDDLEGSVHQVYGGVADPTYLIDADGRVAFYNIWTFGPTLDRVIRALLEQGGRGVVDKGVDRVVHMGPAITDGWRGLRRGYPQSYVDMELAAPGAGLATFVGYQLKPMLAPFTLRAEPLSREMKIGLAVGAAALAGLTALCLARSAKER